MNNELDLKLGIGKQTSWIKNKPILQKLLIMIIGNGQTNQLAEKRTNFQITANLPCMIIEVGQTNQLDEKRINFSIIATLLCITIESGDEKQTSF